MGFPFPLSPLAPTLPHASSCSQWQGQVLGHGVMVHCPSPHSLCHRISVLLLLFLLIPVPLVLVVPCCGLLDSLLLVCQCWCAGSFVPRHWVLVLPPSSFSPVVLPITSLKFDLFPPASSFLQRWCGCWCGGCVSRRRGLGSSCHYNIYTTYI